MLRKFQVSLPVFVLVGLFTFAMSALAQDTSGSGTSATDRTGTSATGSEASGTTDLSSAKMGTIDGTILSVKPDHKTLVIKSVAGGASAGEMEVSFNDQTALAWASPSKDQALPTSSDLVANSEVTVSYETDASGKMIAKNIVIRRASQPPSQ
jgi:hypothetical protein